MEKRARDWGAIKAYLTKIMFARKAKSKQYLTASADI